MVQALEKPTVWWGGQVVKHNISKECGKFWKKYKEACTKAIVYKEWALHPVQAGGVEKGFLEKVIPSLRIMSWNELKQGEGGQTEQRMQGEKSRKANEKGLFGEKHEFPIRRELVFIYLTWTSSCFRNCPYSSQSAFFSRCSPDIFSDNSRLLLRCWKTFFKNETILCCKIRSLKTTLSLTAEFQQRRGTCTQSRGQWEGRAVVLQL